MTPPSVAAPASRGAELDLAFRLETTQGTPLAPELVPLLTAAGLDRRVLRNPHAYVAQASPDALALSAENAARHALTDRVTFHQADLLPPGDTKFDLIIANLPYIPADEIAALSPEVRHDPHAALDGGPDGLDLIRRLIDAAQDRLAPGGALLLEIGAGQADAVNALLSARKFRDISVRPDYQNIPRFAVGFHG